MTVIAANLNEVVEATTVRYLTNPKHLEKFASFCRLFYRYSLDQISSTSHAEFSKEKVEIKSGSSDSRNDIEEAKAVLAAFDAICCGEQIDDQHHYRHAIDSCGLLQFFLHPLLLEHDFSYSGEKPQYLLDYMQVRDRERKEAHRIKMVERQDEFRKILKSVTKNDSKDHDEKAIFYTKRDHIQSTAELIRQFVKKFKQNIGSHSFLAGLIQMLEKQKINNDFHICWTIDACIFTEHVRENSTDNYVLESLVLLDKLFEVFIDEKNDETCNMQSGFIMLRLYIRHGVSNNTIAEFLKQLPRKETLDARPTGSTSTSQSRRYNAYGNDDENNSFFGWVIENFSSCTIS